MNQTAVAVSTRTRNGFTYQANSAYPSEIDAMEDAFRLRNAGRFAFVTNVRQPVTLLGGETIAVGWAVWVKAQPVEQGRAVIFQAAPDCGAMTDSQFEALDAQEIEARAAQQAEANFKRYGRG